MLLILLLYSLFGFTFTLAKITLQHASPFFIVASRMTCAGIGLMTYIYFSRKIRCYPERSDRFLHAQLTIFGIVLPYCSRAWALQYVPASKAALLFNLAPFFVALYSYMLFKEKLSLRKFIGLLLGFFGILPLLMATSKIEDIFGTVGFISLPELALLVSVGSFSYSMIIMQKLIKHRNCPPLLANGLSMLSGGVIALGGAYFFETPWITGNWLIFTGLLASQIIISNIICSQIQAHLLKKYSATLMSLANSITPLSATLFGCLLFGEKITWHYLISFMLVTLGLCIYYYDSFWNRRKKQPAPILVE